MKASRILATVLAAALAVGTMSVSAFADSHKKPTGVGILPAFAGPAILGTTISGPSLHTFTIFKKFHFYKWQSWGWNKVNYLKYKGFDVHKRFYGKKVKVYAKKDKTVSRSSNRGAYVVGCVMGSALGAISASIRKGTALGNPLRWRSQAEHEAIVKSGVEKKYELTSDEAATALAFCGLGSLTLHWNKAPAVVKAKY